MALTGANYNVLWDKSDNALEFADNAHARFGNDNDLSIFHTGSHSIIQNGTGDLRISGNRLELRSYTGGENYLTGDYNGAVELYYDNVKKFETESFGATLTGNLDVNSGSIKILTDSQKLELGAGGDLKIYHDGNHSYIEDAGTGNLILKSNVFRLRSTGDEEMIIANENGNVQLYHDNSKKFETTSSGVTVTGTCTATAFAGDGSSLTGISAGATGGGSDEIFYENSQTITTDYTITSNKNAMSAGPITINNGVSVTVPSGSTYTIV